MLSEKLSRREREQRRRRRYIIDTALRLFSEKGYHNVSMHEIARESEFAIATLYKFFSNKEELYEALILDLQDTVDAELWEILRSDLPHVERLRQMSRIKGDRLCQHLPVVRLFLGETRGTSYNICTGLSRRLKERIDEFTAEVEKIFRDGIERGIFAPHEPAYLARAFIAVGNAALMLSLEDGDVKGHPQSTEEMMDIFFDRILLK